MMFIYMPVVFTNEFTPYIGQIITPILKVKTDLVCSRRSDYFAFTI
jgi:hypothetical protein